MKKYLRSSINSSPSPAATLPYFPLILTPLLLFGPILLSGRALFWGTPSLQFIPWWDYALETLKSGHLPLWNPLVGMGAPLIANYQSALFYPPHWVYLLLGLLGGTSLMAWGMALMVALHLMWAGVGMASLTRRLGLGRLAQTVAGLAFSLSGYLVARVGFLSINAAASWLPWILLFSLAVAEKKALKDSELKSFSVLKLSLVIGLQLLAGHAQTTWYTLVLAGTWVLFWSWVNSDAEKILSRLRDVLSALLGYAGAGLLGLGIAAVQLLPTAQYLLQSQRSSAVDYEFAMTYSFWPWRFLTLLAPDMFGNPARGNYWGYANFWEDAVYLGLLPLLLAFTAVYALRKRRSPLSTSRFLHLTLYALLITLLSFLLALGKNTPIFPWLYNHVPTFNLFQAPTRITLWAVFALSLLAALGVDRWRRPTKRALYWTRLGTAGAFAISLGAGLTWYFMDDVRMTFIRAAALAGLWALGTGILALTAPPRDAENPQPLWQWGVVLWLMADLLVAGWGLNPSIPLDFYHPPRDSLVGRIYLSPQDEYNLKFEYFLLFEDFSPPVDWEDMRAAHLPNLNILDQVPMVNNFDPFVPGRYQRWMDVLEEVEPGPRAEMLNVMGVAAIERVSSERMAVNFTLWKGGRLVRWVGCAEYVKGGEEALDRIASGELDLYKIITLEETPQPLPMDCSAWKGEARLTARQSPNKITIHTDASQPGWVLWSEVWYPGWRAWVDGERSPVVRGDYLFQAIPVPAGEHEVVVGYRPVLFYVGGCISLVALGAVFFFLRKKNQYMVTAEA